jgi:hypothetical protein
MKPAGYSGTPLAKKLGFKDGLTVYVSGAPPGYSDLIGPGSGVIWRKAPGTGLGVAQLFVRDRAKLAAALPALIKAVAPEGAIWVSWPKRASGVQTDITEDVIRRVALPLGLVDIKVCAVDEIWSGLKLVIRKELRAPKGT